MVSSPPAYFLQSKNRQKNFVRSKQTTKTLKKIIESKLKGKLKRKKQLLLNKRGFLIRFIYTH